MDEGAEKVLDALQERACVNTLFLAVFTYSRDIVERKIPGQPLPDHRQAGKRSQLSWWNFAPPHPIELISGHETTSEKF